MKAINENDVRWLIHRINANQQFSPPSTSISLFLIIYLSFLLLKKNVLVLQPVNIVYYILKQWLCMVLLTTSTF